MGCRCHREKECRSCQCKRGPRGCRGKTGSQGPTGPAGPPGIIDDVLPPRPPRGEGPTRYVSVISTPPNNATLLDLPIDNDQNVIVNYSIVSQGSGQYSDLMAVYVGSFSYRNFNGVLEQVFATAPAGGGSANWGTSPVPEILGTNVQILVGDPVATIKWVAYFVIVSSSD